MSARDSTTKSSKVMSLANHSTKVTPQHTLDRVRNNQRRHRERRRDHIATLETKLGEAENEIRSLQEQVLLLKTDLEQCRCGTRNIAQDEPTTDLSISAIDNIGVIPYLGAEINTLEDATTFNPSIGPEGPGLNAVTSFVDRMDTLTAPTLVSSSSTAKHSFNPSTFSGFRPSGCCFRLQDDQLFDPWTIPTTVSSESPTPNLLLEPCNQDMPTHSLSDQFPNTIRPPCIFQQERLEPPISDSIIKRSFMLETDKNESTILCKRAYQLISTQNFKGLSQDQVVSWLSSGFRWPNLKPDTHLDETEIWADGRWNEADDKEDGCRVETTLLFGLLAFISDLWTPPRPWFMIQGGKDEVWV